MESTRNVPPVYICAVGVMNYGECNCGGVTVLVRGRLARVAILINAHLIKIHEIRHRSTVVVEQLAIVCDEYSKVLPACFQLFHEVLKLPTGTVDSSQRTKVNDQGVDWNLGGK